jgi:hypothetical protein
VLDYVYSVLVQDGSVYTAAPIDASEKTVTPVVDPKPIEESNVMEEPAPIKQEMKEIQKPEAVVAEEDQDDDDFVVVDNEDM